jgi:pyruvate-ferredoxin/flavodoxin oxidoreductase
MHPGLPDGWKGCRATGRVLALLTVVEMTESAMSSQATNPEVPLDGSSVDAVDAATDPDAAVDDRPFVSAELGVDGFFPHLDEPTDTASAASARPRYPGTPTVIHGNGAVAHVMSHVCGGVIGYPITPSTEISELYEAARAEGQRNVWGRHAFFFEPEGEHSAQSGALGAALTGGQYISNASSSQGILYAMESHYVTVGKKIGGFVLQVAARVVSKHSLNVMAGHDDVYALLASGYTILFGSNPQEAADLAAIAYRTSALSLIPVANAMDGFSTSHMLSEARLPEPELLRVYLGDPAGRIPCPTVAQEMLFGAKGRVFQLGGFLTRHSRDIPEGDVADLRAFLAARAEEVERDSEGELVGATLAWVPEELHGAWRRQWVNSWEKGTRQLVPALVDVNNPGLTGPVQNQPDFQAGAVDHRTHFASAVPALARQAMSEYSELTGRSYAPVLTYDCDDADVVMVGLGSVCDDVRAVLPHLRERGIRAGLVSVKLLQPFPEAEVVAALAGTKAVMVLERSDQTALTSLVTAALFRARENAVEPRHDGVPALDHTPRLTTAIFGLGGHDLQPRHLVAAFREMDAGTLPPLVYLGSQFFEDHPSERTAEVQERLRAAYPETQLMALRTEANPALLPPDAMRIRFHSVGGYGTIATGKLLTDILAGLLGMHSKSAPKYGSEKSGAPTNYYITLSPEPIWLTNAELEEVEVVIAPDHKAFIHTNPLKGLVPGGTFILQTSLSPEEVWRELPAHARRTIRERQIRFFTIDAFTVARRHAPTSDLETRMMGIAFIGAVAAHVDRVAAGAPREQILERVRHQLEKKFGRKGESVVESNMAVIVDGIEATRAVDYDAPELVAIGEERAAAPLLTVALSASMCPSTTAERTSGLFDPAYYEDLMLRPFREGTIAEAPVLPGIGLFMPPGTGAGKDKGLFRREVPRFDAGACTGCLDCALVCPDAAIPNTVHEVHDLLLTAIDRIEATPGQRESLRQGVYGIAERTREALRHKDERPFHEVVETAASTLRDDPGMAHVVGRLVAELAAYPVARTRPFFDSPEREQPGTGGLFAATVDPWKCTGCLECIDVCGPGALTVLEQDADVLEGIQQRFGFMSALPNTPERFIEGSDTPDGDIKRLMLDHENFYATTGGHGGCRGCGEVTAIRLVMSTSHAVGERRRRQHLRELTDLVDRLYAKRATVQGRARQRRLTETIATLERRLYEQEGGPTGNGPASTIVANSTGCSSVYASTMPFTNFLDPWVNSLFQDAQPLAKGIFEGVAAQSVADVRALRVAELELADSYDPDVHDAELATLSWGRYSPAEMELLPTVLTIGGDGASYDIGFGAMSRILASDTPVKVLVLNSGVYSNTGGQTSTASLTGQDSDLARFGSAHDGKHEARKELGLLASFHPNVYVCSTSTAMQGHFLTSTMEFLRYQDAAAVLDVYTPCGSEHGIPEEASARRARLAVESRMNPLFVHDPRRGSTLHDWFSLDGNPDVDKPWASTDLAYRDDAGELRLMRLPLTPAEFALGETRFRKQFTRLPDDLEPVAVRIDEYVELSREEQAVRVPFVHATDEEQRLIKVQCSAAIVALVEDRRRYWQVLQYLSGVHEAKLTALHESDLADLRERYEQAVRDRESSIDDIAQAMSSLATSSRAPVGQVPATALRSGGSAVSAAPAGTPAAAGDAGTVGDVGAVGSAPTDAPIHLDEVDLPKCNDCGTCYQELPQLFEPHSIVVDGAVQKVARMIPGALETVEMTPELLKRAERVRNTCDAEIIR